jgi:DNA-binding transcriptional regulator YiaG
MVAMVNHPNRSGRIAESQPPSPDEIRQARQDAGLSQTSAGALVHSGLRTWQQWEAGDRAMHPGLWELFRIKTDRA